MGTNAPTYSWTLDLATCRFLDVNAGFVQLTGYSKPELLKMDLFDIVAVEQHERLRQHMKTRGESGVTGEWLCRRKDGSHFTMTVRFHNFETHGNVVSFVFASRVSEESVGQAPPRP